MAHPISKTWAALVALALLFGCQPANAQNSGKSAGGQTVPGSVSFCFTGATQADGSLTVAPCQFTPVTGTFSGADTTTAAATLTGVAGKTTYICGFQVNGLGLTTGATVQVAVATIAPGNTLNFAYTFPTGAAVVATPITQTFSPCLPASAAGANITVTVPGGAGNTSTNISAWGYLQ
jgi:hypothetical protein